MKTLTPKWLLSKKVYNFIKKLHIILVKNTICLFFRGRAGNKFDRLAVNETLFSNKISLAGMSFRPFFN